MFTVKKLASASSIKVYLCSPADDWPAVFKGVTFINLFINGRIFYNFDSTEVLGR